MSAAVYRDEPGKVASVVMAVAVHVAFLILLVLGVSWQHHRPAVVEVELWSDLPPVPSLKAPVRPPPPAPEVAIKPPPPPPPPVEVKPPPRVELQPAPEPKPIVKPDIALEKEKQEKERRIREELARVEARKKEEARKREELAQAEARRKAQARKREELAQAEARKKEEARKREELAQAEIRRKEAAEKQRIAALEAEQARREREQQEALRRLQQQEAAAQSAARAEFVGKIRAKIRRYIVVPPNIKGNPQVEFEVVLLPTGDVLGVKLKKGSEYAAYDSAVERAIMKAQPLPVPKDSALFKDFRELHLQFRPNE
jgi:colicin import membrane protein